VEEDLSAQWQLERCRGIYDVFALDVLRKRIESLKESHDKGQYVSLDELVTHIGQLGEMKEEKGANNNEEDTSELLASGTPTVLAFRLLAPALAPGESGAAGSRSRRCEFFVLARDSLGITILDVDSGIGEQRSALSL
jgi:hypothetical protein